MRTLTSPLAAVHRIVVAAVLAGTIATCAACGRSTPALRDDSLPQGWLEALVRTSVDVHPLARDTENAPLVLDLAAVRAIAAAAGLPAPDSARLAEDTKRSVVSVDRTNAIECGVGGCTVLSNGLLFVLTSVERDSIGLKADVEYVTTLLRGESSGTCSIPAKVRLVAVRGGWRVESALPSRRC